MSIAHYLREIGRGKQGARDLDRDQAEDLMTRVLEDRVDPVALGAFAIAMRIKGETPDELLGFLAAARRHLMPLPGHDDPAAPPVVWLPSYNGGRKLPNLTPLLARLLAQQGLRVLVHGVVDDPGRITTHQLFETLGWPVCPTPEALGQAWSQGLPAFVPIARLNPALARLLALRQVVGLRNPAHTIAKLLSPAATTATLTTGPVRHFRVVNHTHPEYAESLAAFLRKDAADALLMRGTEGEPVANLRRTPAMHCFRAGVPGLQVPLQEGGLTALDLGESGKCNLAQTLTHIQQHPVPEPIRVQVDTVVAGSR